MTRFVTALAFGCAVTVAAHAQDVKSKTEIKGDNDKTVTYTGCLRTGTETRTFVLQNVVPVRTTETRGTTGEVSTTTTYALVPAERVELQQFVGHKVEVTGMMIPAGDSKTTTRTKIEREGAPDTEIKEKTETAHDTPQFRVLSVKHLAESCS